MKQPFFDRFTAWEHRGRGGELSPDRRPLEPEFQEFEENSESLAKRTLFASDPAPDNERSLTGRNAEDSGELVELQLKLQSGRFPQATASQALLNALYEVKTNLSFEIIGSADGPVFQFVCPRLVQSEVRSAIESFFPEVEISERSEYLRARWSANLAHQAIVELGLFQGFHLPIARGPSFSRDALIPIIGAMSRMRRKEHAAIQVIFAAVSNLWGRELWKAFASMDSTDEQRALEVVSKPSLGRLRGKSSSLQRGGDAHRADG